MGMAIPVFDYSPHRFVGHFECASIREVPREGEAGEGKTTRRGGDGRVLGQVERWSQECCTVMSLAADAWSPGLAEKWAGSPQFSESLL